ncbi:alpha/beta hydrolase family protein [Mycolicibacterium sp. BiH015]|nr:alpha/beta hydrolase family protein [Mycolicibacterium sp. BiH015]MDA2893245.1 alpha/beta hydrolase family protein [Mycolicibacterium sp. BiH015]
MTTTTLLSCAPSASGQPTDGVEYLMVPSAAMGRDIPVAFLQGGPQAVFLLDAANAGAAVSNWVTAGDAVNTVAGQGISLVAPASGAYSFYTNWEQDRSRQWDTFLAAELPTWLAANRGLAVDGHAAVGASQGGTGALMLAASHPQRFRYAASVSGFLTPSNTTLNGAIAAGMTRFGGVDTNHMWGPPQLGRWKWRDPGVNVRRFVDNDTRLWIYAPQTLTTSDQAAMLGYPDQAQASSRVFYAHYVAAGGRNGHFEFPISGDHGWSSWRSQLRALTADMAAWLKPA